MPVSDASQSETPVSDDGQYYELVMPASDAGQSVTSVSDTSQ